MIFLKKKPKYRYKIDYISDDSKIVITNEVDKAFYEAKLKSVKQNHSRLEITTKGYECYYLDNHESFPVGLIFMKEEIKI